MSEVKTSQDVVGYRRIWRVSGAPTDGASGTLYGRADPGDVIVDIATSKLYINSNTKASPIWSQILSADVAFEGDVSIEGDITLTTEDVSVAQGKFIYLEGQDSTTYLVAASAGVLTIEAATSINLGADLMTDRWAADGRNTFLGMNVCSGGGVTSPGVHNVALGYGAAAALTTGAQNTLLGSQAGDNITTADNCIIIGFDIEAPSATVDGQMKIGGLTGMGYILGDGTGDMTINALSGKLINLAINAVDEVRISGAALYPATDDGQTLGILASNEWSDLFLASEGVIGWNNNDVTITHAANLLTVAGGNLRMGTTDRIEFRDAGIYIYSQANGKLTISADGTGTDDLTLGCHVTISGVLTSARIDCTSIQPATNTTSGSIQTDGGLGVVKQAYIGETLNVAGLTTCTGGLRVLSALHLFAGAIETSDLADDCVNSSKLASPAVSPGNLATACVQTAKIADGAVTLAKLAVNSVNANRIVDNAVTTAKIINDAITSDKIAAGAVTVNKILANAIRNAAIQDGAITLSKLAVNSVNANRIVDGSVETDKLADDAVTAAKIASPGISAGNLSTGCVTEAKIATGAVTGTKIPNLTIGTDHLGNNKVTNAKTVGHTGSVAGGVTTLVVTNGLVTSCS